MTPSDVGAYGRNQPPSAVNSHSQPERKRRCLTAFAQVRHHLLQVGSGGQGRGRAQQPAAGLCGHARQWRLMLDALRAPPSRLTRSALNVGQTLRHPPSPDPHQVGTTDMPVRPAVVPPDDDPITRAEHLLHFKMRGW